MIDIHTHIIPEVDDGANSIETAVEMAKVAVQDGIRTVFATPHHANRYYRNEPESLSPKLERLIQELQLRNIPLEVKLGQEVHIGSHVLNELYNNYLLTLGESRYMLIELPSSQVPSNLPELIHELRLRHIIPIIAHPERNAVIANNLDILFDWVSDGVLTQLTSLSVIGRFGSTLQKISLEMCRRNLVHFIATDAHNLDHRPFVLSEAYDTIGRRLGHEYTEYYLTNARGVVENQLIDLWEPQKASVKWWNFWSKTKAT